MKTPPLTPHTRLAAALLMALTLSARPLHATETAPAPAPPAAHAACPAADAVTVLHLIGAWRVTWDDLPEPALLTLGRDPDNPGGVRGTLTRRSGPAQLAGDVEQGDFTLEESTDGQHISANWVGSVTADRCGQDIRGLWTAADAATQHRFVLRKQHGWD